MKKIICLLLIVAMALGLNGCGMGLWFLGAWKSSHISEGEKQKMLEHLEAKYGEEFVIESVVTPDNEAEAMRGARVHPEGKEDDSFFVQINVSGSIIDEYPILLNERRMFSLYEEWIQSMIPSAKVAISISGHLPHDMAYNPEQSFEEFVCESEYLSLDVNIVLSEDMLENKDEIFKTLSAIPASEPISGYWSSSYNIGFFTKEAFDGLKSGEYVFIPPYLDVEDTDFTAVTSFGQIYKNNTQQNYSFIKQLKDNFKTKENVE